MKRRGLATVTALVAVTIVACTSDGEGAGELRDIREVVAEAESDPTGEARDGGEVELPAEREGASAEAPEPVEAEPAETPEPDPDIDITMVPEEITLEYVQAVLDELERIYANAVVMMMEEGELTLDITDHIGEIFALRQRDIRIEEFVETAAAGFPGMREPQNIEVRRRIAQEILDLREGCVYVRTVTTDTPFFLEPAEPIDVYVILETPTVERPVDINPTPWVYGAFGVGQRDEMTSVSPCAA